MCLGIFFVVRSLVRWWYGRSRKDTDDNTPLRQWETDYLLNSEPELRMFYEYHDMGMRFNQPQEIFYDPVVVKFSVVFQFEASFKHYKVKKFIFIQTSLLSLLTNLIKQDTRI